MNMLKFRYVKEHPEGELVVQRWEVFEKTYILRNDGDDEWPETATMCYVGETSSATRIRRLGKLRAEQRPLQTDLHCSSGRGKIHEQPAHVRAIWRSKIRPPILELSGRQEA